MTLMLAALAFVLAPLGILYLLHRVPRLQGLNPIIPAYAIGILLSFLIPHDESMLALQDAVSSATVLLSIPLMLFAVDLRRWRDAGRPALISLLLATVSIVVAVAVGHLLFQDRLTDSAQVGGMLIGVYTGGTPNLAAIRTALQVDTSLYLTVHTADIVVSALYILFLITVGKRVFSRLLPVRVGITVGGGAGVGSGAVVGSDARAGSGAGAGASAPTDEAASRVDYGDILRRSHRRQSLLALGLAVAVVAVSAGVALLLAPDNLTVAVILLVSTLGLLASLLPGVSRLTTSFRMGEFLILIFAIAVGSMAEVAEVLAASPAIIGYVTVAVFGSLALHTLLARLLRIGPETVMVTSIAAICSPPFVGMLAPVIRNPQVLAAGITTGIIGYAAGTYLGVTVAWMLGML